MATHWGSGPFCGSSTTRVTLFEWSRSIAISGSEVGGFNYVDPYGPYKYLQYKASFYISVTTVESN